MSYGHLEVELFSLWAKRAILVSIIKEHELQLSELNSEVDRVQKLVDEWKKAEEGE